MGEPRVSAELKCPPTNTLSPLQFCKTTASWTGSFHSTAQLKRACLELAGWLRSSEHLLLLQRILFQFLASTLGGSQLSVTLAPGNPRLPDCSGACAHRHYTHIGTHRHIHTINKKINPKTTANNKRAWLESRILTTPILLHIINHPHEIKDPWLPLWASTVPIMYVQRHVTFVLYTKQPRHTQISKRLMVTLKVTASTFWVWCPLFSFSCIPHAKISCAVLLKISHTNYYMHRSSRATAPVSREGVQSATRLEGTATILVTQNKLFTCFILNNQLPQIGWSRGAEGSQKS